MAKKNTKIIESLNHGCYPGYTMLVVGFTKKDLLNELNKRKTTTGWADAAAHLSEIDTTHWTGQMVEMENQKTGVKQKFFFLTVPRKFNFMDDEDYVKLAHECHHIETFFMQNVLNRDREFEATAYFHSHLMSQALKALRK